MDRAGLVLRVPLPPNEPVLIWLRDGPRSLAIQREFDGSGTAILDWVPAGATPQWRLEAGSPPADAVKVSTRTAAIDIAVEGSPVLGFPLVRTLASGFLHTEFWEPQKFRIP